MAEPLAPLRGPSEILTLADSLDNEARHADVAAAVGDEITVLYARTMQLTAATLRDLLARAQGGEAEHPTPSIVARLTELALKHGEARRRDVADFTAEIANLPLDVRFEISVLLAGLATVAHPTVPTSPLMDRPRPSGGGAAA